MDLLKLLCLTRSKHRGKFKHLQGPKLTFFGRRQLATEFFFQSPNGKMWSPKSVFLLQRNTSGWKILVANFLSRIKMKSMHLGLQWQQIKLNTNTQIIYRHSRPYTQFYATAKCFKSTLYHLLHPAEKLPFGSLLYVQNDLSFRALSR